MMYILPNYDRRDAICVRLFTQNSLDSSHVCHGVINPAVVKTGNESTVQI